MILEGKRNDKNIYRYDFIVAGCLSVRKRLMNIAYEFGNVLRSGRKEMKITQTELARRTNRTAHNITEYEMGDNLPRIDRAQQLLRAVGYDLQIIKMEG